MIHVKTETGVSARTMSVSAIREFFSNAFRLFTCCFRGASNTNKNFPSSTTKDTNKKVTFSDKVTFLDKKQENRIDEDDEDDEDDKVTFSDKKQENRIDEDDEGDNNKRIKILNTTGSIIDQIVDLLGINETTQYKLHSKIERTPVDLEEFLTKLDEASKNDSTEVDPNKLASPNLKIIIEELAGMVTLNENNSPKVKLTKFVSAHLKTIAEPLTDMLKLQLNKNNSSEVDQNELASANLETIIKELTGMVKLNNQNESLKVDQNKLISPNLETTIAKQLAAVGMVKLNNQNESLKVDQNKLISPNLETIAEQLAEVIKLQLKDSYSRKVDPNELLALTIEELKKMIKLQLNDNSLPEVEQNKLALPNLETTLNLLTEKGEPNPDHKFVRVLASKGNNLIDYFEEMFGLPNQQTSKDTNKKVTFSDKKQENRIDEDDEDDNERTKFIGPKNNRNKILFTTLSITDQIIDLLGINQKYQSKLHSKIENTPVDLEKLLTKLDEASKNDSTEVDPNKLASPNLKIIIEELAGMVTLNENNSPKVKLTKFVSAHLKTIAEPLTDMLKLQLNKNNSSEVDQNELASANLETIIKELTGMVKLNNQNESLKVDQNKLISPNLETIAEQLAKVIKLQLKDSYSREVDRNELLALTIEELKKMIKLQLNDNSLPEVEQNKLALPNLETTLNLLTEKGEPNPDHKFVRVLASKGNNLIDYFEDMFGLPNQQTS